MADLSNIRNFCIIAHIDHGKSTLADRILQLTHTVDDRQFRDQMLDSMDLERERGITIKSHPVHMRYTARSGKTLELNLIDTPGHVDFAYEVSRSMAACEGAVLLVDAGQGVEAQTVANTYLAMDRGLTIIPVINKIDHPNADVDEAIRQIEEILALPRNEIIQVSAKTGIGVEALLEAIIERVPPPTDEPDQNPCRALIFDSKYDAFRGAVSYVRIIHGTFETGQRIRMLASGTLTDLKEIGIFSPLPLPVDSLTAGQVGYLVGTIKDPRDILIGDTVTHQQSVNVTALPGFKKISPMVFSGLYPIDTSDFERFRQNIEKLHLNDSSFTYHPENSVALGFGFRCGFLGLLHMEVIQERLRREFDMDIISTHPSVIYRITLKNGETKEIDNPVDLPDPTRIETICEPFIKATLICQNEHIGDMMRLIMERRGQVTHTESIDKRRVMLTASLPLNEVLTDFHDALKSVTHGYASMDYEYDGYRASDIVRMDILLNSEPVDAFSVLIHRERAESKGRQMCASLRDAIPPHQFAIPVQAAISKRIIARETIRPFRKDVTAKLYGGDVTRKRKLLDKQKEGKKRMKEFGQVNVPQKAFISVLKGGGT
ncbi:MAG: elongation factor 4 [Lentisphaerae bacterium RIFOXYA12_FULL_60_10]|nr:MAG: elongation factor 4 [Lentisphaerae bacterium RIFOXYA12_FULL_60_10]